ncbi:probable cytochrome P450 301a1, mitochondrial isoform X2 [Eriocheir sinensis]|nr:probable cytochrome P450 301a1, mitochondrial isoform X2 [Eriocheir sinensis]XP_050733402.1 probable cytochrome P450 301a1, mitochondrial isoform X2 [Eriocheir sinensis]XP_050733403.1 probable cytochrome P450 301a1, mitochondrial isoform X2 [Eriocheir sinensis]XP_050733404.1 probable cytochrome P450 301a1, mitochondrial isoform X2 [Eriocheir sinensis]
MLLVWRVARRPLLTTPCLVTARQKSLDAAPQIKRKDGALRSVREIPGPPTFPLLGCLPSLVASGMTFNLKRIHKFFEGLIHKYGPIVRIETAQMPPGVLVINADHTEAMIRATMDNPIRNGFLSLKKIRLEMEDDYFEGKTGLLSENGEEWWRVRSKVQTPMMKPKNVASYLPQVDQITLEFIERMAFFQAKHGEMPHDFQTELYKWALESVGVVALNRRLGCLTPDLPGDSEPMRLIGLVSDLFHNLNLTEFGVHTWRIFPTRPYRTVREKHTAFLRLVDSNIQETEALLLAQGREDREATLMESLLMTPGLSRKDVITLILDMILAGIDTTSHSIGFTLYLLARHPAVQTKLQEEVDTVLRGHEGPLTAQHLAKLSYLKAVIKESLRIFPLVLGTIRTLEKDLILDNYVIPKNWSVLSMNMLTGWEETYFPRAKEFLPERWLRHKPLGPIHPYASLPFGAGVRMCIGRRLAEQEMYIFLTRVMQRFTLDYKYEDIDIITSLVCIPSQPLRFNLIERT